MSIVSRLFGNRRSPNALTYFDIRLDEDTLYLPGYGESTSYGRLSGTVVLCLNKPLAVKDIKLHAKGVRYVNWDWRTPDGQHKRAAWREIPFYRQIWSFLNASKGSSQTTLEPGNYEFPFSVSLHRSMPVSVEGLEDCYIRYGLTATIFRGHAGRVTTSRNMSVSRSQSHLALPEPESIENIWPEKLIYQMSMPGKTFNKGGPIKLDFRYVPLTKGIQPKTIKLQLVEKHSIHLYNNPVLGRTRERVICEDESGIGECLLDTNTVASERQPQEEEWLASSHCIWIPRSTPECLPSSRTNIIDVTHTLKIWVRLLNSDGHYSEIVTKFPISICSAPDCKPNVPSLYALCGNGVQPPPAYEDHVRDPLFDGTNIQMVERGLEDDRVESSQPHSQTDELVAEPETNRPSNLSLVPCYMAAIQSQIPRSAGSPHYWSVVSGG
ncbi:hypothetical protein N7510_002973 [Penicillium lagena]|uniref:uncharacterized protein n=1 Tax=Penicillium lagena TaxID=94218 RepID=UPI002540E96A|nr:uncharacterized protein N7510_002973 [Penicillium lagena]KAJ5618989.1 hypothetical protein N7510_002973 [Penicillium lagena]